MVVLELDADINQDNMIIEDRTCPWVPPKSRSNCTTFAGFRCLGVYSVPQRTEIESQEVSVFAEAKQCPIDNSVLLHTVQSEPMESKLRGAI